MVPSGLELCSKVTQTNLCTRSLAGRLLQQQTLVTHGRTGARALLAAAPCLMGGFGCRIPMCFLAPLS